MRDQLNHIELGGWHFSYFMSADLIKNKILAIADVENISKFKSLDMSEIKNKMIAGYDLFDRPISFTKKIDLNEIPCKLVEILKKYLPDCVPKKP
jgi:beta-1,4-mannosyl-glycoprotein beta-1,4-N-acetylglucosaminyltransferase